MAKKVVKKTAAPVLKKTVKKAVTPVSKKAVKKAAVPAAKKSTAAGAACSVSSAAVFDILVETYRKMTKDKDVVTRATKLGDEGVGLDSENTVILASKTILNINKRDSACKVTGIHDSEIAAQSKTFGKMADVIFKNLG